jgi:hypothetical protein
MSLAFQIAFDVHEDVVALETDPHDPVPGRAVGAEGGQMHVVRRIEELANITRAGS